MKETLKHKNREWFWSDEEIKLLKRLFHSMKLIDIQREYFSHRTFRALRNKVCNLKLYKGHISESYVGNKNATGYKHTIKLKRRFSKERKGIPKSIEHKLKIAKAHLGQKKSKESIEKTRKGLIKRWKDPNFVKKMVRAFGLKPNKKEKELFELIEQVCPNEYKFVGDGKLVVDGLIPDFVNINGQKKIIEFFGDYWHSDKVTNGSYRRSEEGRKKIFANFGYRTLVIWQSEFENLSKNEIMDKIEEFKKW